MQCDKCHVDTVAILVKFALVTLVTYLPVLIVLSPEC